VQPGAGARLTIEPNTENPMKAFPKTLSLAAVAALFTFAITVEIAHADSGKLLATGGVSQVEGAGGGGLTPWALITGYETRDGVGATAFYTNVGTPNFSLDVVGAAVGLFDRVELSVARQRFNTGDTGVALGLGPDFSFRQDIVGAKVRLFGDAVYGQDSWLPQVAVGLQYKENKEEAVVRLLGAKDDSGTDFYLSGTKLLLAQSLLLNATVRGTKANQMGLLGFGGDKNDSYKLQFEGSAALLLNRHLAVGIEYRGKPDNLGFAQEDDWRDVFVAFFPNKNLSITAGYAQLGSIATIKNQNGPYLSVQAAF
jgi:hypothetical protein